MRRRAVIAALLLLSGPGVLMGRAARDDAPQARKLAGKWRVVYGEVAGEAVPVRDLPAETMSFLTDGRWSWGFNDGTWVGLDAPTPKAVDLIATGRGPAEKQLGIYGVVGDTLTMVVALPGDPERPATLDSSTATPPSSLYVFWRISK